MKAETKNLSIFSVIVVILIVITIFSLRNINHFVDDTKWMTHSRDVSMVLSNNLSDMQAVETGSRGFLITGKASYLLPFHLASPQLKRNIIQLRILSKDNPIQLLRTDTLERLSLLQLFFSKEVIDFRKHYGLESAVNLVNKDDGRKTMDAIRSITTRMQNTEKILLEERTKITKESLLSTKFFVFFGGLFSIIVFVFLMIFIKRALKLERELKKSKEHAEKLVGFKDDFLASMSHEIRTPLNGIIGFTKILLRNEIINKQKPHLDAIKTSSDILLVLINDILDLAKIEAGKMIIESTELKLRDLVNNILGTFELRFDEKDLKIIRKYDDRIPVILLGDPVRINQILLNLLSNSVKFTGDGGQIGVNIRLLNQDSESANIEFIVSDNGIGIPEDKLKTIFESFTQSSNDIARKYGGTGLGLTIVKRLTDLMGGTISVNSQLKVGSSFTVLLPLKKTDAIVIPKEVETKIHDYDVKSQGKLKILLVEDIPINQFLAQTILHDFGFESDIAENGKMAIELLEKNDYDIVLMDLMMPEMNGFEATKHIRNTMLPPKSTIPIIALTADVTKADVDRCEEAGMNEYVSKPINENELLKKIMHQVKKHKKLL
ncbi:MAG: ATP-binding protein [Bacteroidota bacterium]|nr:ATP-binding protein [Bacteroidota bacterium]